MVEEKKKCCTAFVLSIHATFEQLFSQGLLGSCMRIESVSQSSETFGVYDLRLRVKEQAGKVMLG